MRADLTSHSTWVSALPYPRAVDADMRVFLPQMMEHTGLIPLDGDVTKITRKAEEFKDLHEALQRNLQTYLTLTMDAIAGIHQKLKAAGYADATRLSVSVPCFYQYPTALNYWLRLLDTSGTPEKVAFADDVCGHPQISYVSGRVLVPCPAGRGDLFVRSAPMCVYLPDQYLGFA